MDNKNIAGGWSGGIPYGYQYNHDNNSIEKNSKEHKILMRIIALRRKAMGVNTIAKSLNKEGLRSRTGLDWSNVTVGYVLTEARLNHYAGYYSDGTMGYWEPFITKNEVDKLMIDKEEIGSRGAKDNYLLTGLGVMKCGYCGGTVKSSTTLRPDGTKSLYYVCTNKSMKGTCPDSKLVKQQVVNDAVLTDLIIKHENAESLEREYAKTFGEKHKLAKESIKKSQKELAELLQKSIKTSDELTLKQIDKRIDTIMKENKEALMLAVQGFNFSAFMSAPIKKIKTLTVDKQQHILRDYIESVTLWNDKLEIIYPFKVNTKVRL
jgi:site-specific DNA recombinase